MLTNDNKKILISSIYNSPTSSITNFTNFIINNFTRLLTNDIFYAEILTLIFHGLMIIIFYILYIDSMNSLGLFPLINKPTRIGDYSNTIIDNILTNCKISPEIVGLFITDISDHLPIFSIYNNLFTFNLILIKQKYIRFRSSNYSNINYLNKSLLDYNRK